MLPASAYTRPATLAGQPLTGLVDPRKAVRAVRRRRDRRAPGTAPLLAAAHRPGRRAGARARPPLPGQRLPHAAGLAGLRGAQRHPRRLRLPDPRPQAVGGPRGRRGGEDACVLEPGVSMYLPTGTPHAARAQDTVSLHVTIGINQVTWRGAARAGRRRRARRHRCRPPARRLPRRPGAAGRGAGRPAGGARRARCASCDAGELADGRGAPVPHRPRRCRQRGGLTDRIAVARPRRRHACCAAARATRACWGPTATGSGCCSATAS